MKTAMNYLLFNTIMNILLSVCFLIVFLVH